MTRNQFLFGFSLLGFSIVLPSWGQISNTERVGLSPGGIVRVNGTYGDMYVEGWDKPEVEIKTTRSALVRIAVEPKSASELAISTILPAHGGRKAKREFNPTYEIRLPRDSHLVIHHGDGFVHVANMTGDIEVTSRSGDITLWIPDDAQYSIDGQTKLGIFDSDFAGDYIRRRLVGRRFSASNSASQRRIVLRMGLGGITIKKVPPEASFRAGQL